MQGNDLFGKRSRVAPAYDEPKARDAYSVSGLNFAIRDLLEGQFFYCLVEGEISNAAFPGSGHIYFNLKDDGAVIKAVIWRTQAVMFRTLIANGQKVRLTGKISVYAPRGEYQLIVNRVEEAGKGDLHLQFEALKKKLHQEGLFEDHYKKRIPLHPRRIGLVTSGTAAALQDVLNVLASHRPDIGLTLYPTRVQGEGAEKEIAAAIEQANRDNTCDLLLLVRGGGSIEDLWVFNEEVVARAIFASHIPIISGIGHETDTTIADFVADLRAPTPSIAAKYSSQSKDELLQQLSDYQERIYQLMGRKSEVLKQRLLMLQHRLKMKEPKLQLVQSKRDLTALKERLRIALTHHLTQTQFSLSQLTLRLNNIDIREQQATKAEVLSVLEKRLITATKWQQERKEMQFVTAVEKLNLLSPLNVLLRGYSMTTTVQGAVVKSVEQVKRDDQLKVMLADGELKVQVL